MSCIWFHLVGSDGGPYQRTRPTKLHGTPPNADVDDFVKQVQAYYADTLLKDIAACQLVAYKNRAAFDAKQPLDLDQSLDSLGRSLHDKLIVVVPPSSILPIQTTRCQVPFFNNICNAKEKDNWISFEQNIPSTALNKLFIRECYRTIVSNIKPGISKTTITGTPGIGKSLLLVYLLWKLVKEGKRVLFTYHPYNIYYDGNGGIFRIATKKLPDESNSSFWNDSLWCLFDAKDVTHLSAVPYALCTFVLSTSPRRDLVNDFKKPPIPQDFYVPPWTKTELEAIAVLFPHAINWHERYEVLGGIPRFVLEDTKGIPTKLIEAACTLCSLDDCIKMIDLNSTIVEDTVHHLIHITSTSSYTVPSVQYASQITTNIIVQKKAVEVKYRIVELLVSCRRNPLTAALCECIFESYAIELLEKGGSFASCEMLAGEARGFQFTLNILPSTKVVVERVEEDQIHNQLYVPKSSKYAAVDAWIPGIGAFQMPVGKSHTIKGGAENDLNKLETTARKLYWLLPPLYYTTFKKKDPMSIQQYAVRIPYPN